MYDSVLLFVSFFFLQYFVVCARKRWRENHTSAPDVPVSPYPWVDAIALTRWVLRFRPGERASRAASGLGRQPSCAASGSKLSWSGGSVSRGRNPWRSGACCYSYMGSDTVMHRYHVCFCCMHPSYGCLACFVLWNWIDVNLLALIVMRPCLVYRQKSLFIPWCVQGAILISLSCPSACLCVCVTFVVFNEAVFCLQAKKPVHTGVCTGCHF